jgi:quercetin dioxygenase-like cupin family protein
VFPAATLRAVSRTGPRLVVAVGLAALVLVLTGCAQPGQLGHPAPEPPPPPVASAMGHPAAPPPPRGPDPITGRVEDRVTMRTTGPAVYSVETIVLGPGESTGWHRHPGTELAIVRSGEVTVRREGACRPTRYTAGEAVFVDDGSPHLASNDGAVPAEMVVTHLLDPGVPERSSVPPAC